jgi:hypothetical protein
MLFPTEILWREPGGSEAGLILQRSIRPPIALYGVVKSRPFR